MPLLAALGALMGVEVEAVTGRIKAGLLINGAIAVLALVGVGFLIAAGYIALAGALGGLYAALIMGGAFLILALAVYLGAQIGAGRRRQEEMERRRSGETGAFVTTAALTALPVLAKSPMVLRLGLPAAAIAAYLLFRKNDDA